MQKCIRNALKPLLNFDFLLVEVYFTKMKRILITTVVLANMGLTAIACEFHGGGYYSPYDWYSDGFNNIPIEETSTEASASEKVRPDFRYSRAKPPASEEDSSVEEQDESKS